MAPRFRGLPSPKNAIFPMEIADSERLEGDRQWVGGRRTRTRTRTDGNGNSQPTPVPNAPGKKIRRSGTPLTPTEIWRFRVFGFGFKVCLGSGLGLRCFGWSMSLRCRPRAPPETGMGRASHGGAERRSLRFPTHPIPNLFFGLR